ncbi:MAG: hypothetical protein ACLFTG_14240, partial [Alphaproteobacteria bacterium]
VVGVLDKVEPLGEPVAQVGEIVHGDVVLAGRGAKRKEPLLDLVEPARLHVETLGGVGERVFGFVEFDERAVERAGGPDHETVLRASAFHRLDRLEAEVRRAWTLDGVVGYVRSTSRGKEALAGADGAERERELRGALAELGHLDEAVTVTAIVAQRP